MSVHECTLTDVSFIVLELPIVTKLILTHSSSECIYRLRRSFQYILLPVPVEGAKNVLQRNSRDRGTCDRSTTARLVIVRRKPEVDTVEEGGGNTPVDG